MRHLSVLAPAFTLLLAACTHVPSHSLPPARKPESPVPVLGRPATLPPAASTGVVAPVTPGLSYRPLPPGRQRVDGAQVPAVQGLLAASDRALRSKDLDLAAVNLERAQRLAPQSALVYQRLADVRLRQKRPAEAEQLARKALAYAGSTAQQALLWRQIAQARQQLGQTQSAQEALAHATVLENAAAGHSP
ncbi:MAG: hypothetical protein PSX71_04895 [bacterium]|nr:hypothetical protein [bacterium]